MSTDPEVVLRIFELFEAEAEAETMNKAVNKSRSR